MPKKLDKETQKVLSDGEKIARFVASEDWALIKNRLNSKLIQFDSILTVVFGNQSETRDAAEIGQEMMMRKMLIQTILDWVREIEGEAEQHKNNTDAMLEIKVDSHVRYLP